MGLCKRHNLPSAIKLRGRLVHEVITCTKTIHNRGGNEEIIEHATNCCVTLKVMLSSMMTTSCDNSDK